LNEAAASIAKIQKSDADERLDRANVRRNIASAKKKATEAQLAESQKNADRAKSDAKAIRDRLNAPPKKGAFNAAPVAELVQAENEQHLREVDLASKQATDEAAERALEDAQAEFAAAEATVNMLEAALARGAAHDDPRRQARANEESRHCAALNSEKNWLTGGGGAASSIGGGLAIATAVLAAQPQTQTTGSTTTNSTAANDKEVVGVTAGVITGLGGALVLWGALVAQDQADHLCVPTSWLGDAGAGDAAASSSSPVEVQYDTRSGP
jgi:hypothetical protein